MQAFLDSIHYYGHGSNYWFKKTYRKNAGWTFWYTFATSPFTFPVDSVIRTNNFPWRSINCIKIPFMIKFTTTTLSFNKCQFSSFWLFFIIWSIIALITICSVTTILNKRTLVFIVFIRRFTNFIMNTNTWIWFAFAGTWKTGTF